MARPRRADPLRTGSGAGHSKQGTARPPRRLSPWIARWGADGRTLLELFVLSNLAFLTLDVYIAHAVNDFRDPLEWVPVGFAAVGSAALGVALVRRGPGPAAGGSASRLLGLAVGWGAIATGVGGLLLHLESRFFTEVTLESLVYSAPFAAPLAFTGLGLLLLMNRMVASESVEWSRWVLLLALGGFVGNFALSLADHAQNGFFYAQEWISVVASAFAVGFLMVATFGRPRRRFLLACYGVMAVQVLVGLLGFWFHLAARFRGDGAVTAGWRYEVIFGAPVFAPLLFVDLALLAALGLWDLRRKTE